MESSHYLIEQFLIAYTKNQLSKIIDILDENITIHYSTIGFHSGINNVLNILKFNQLFDINTVTISNEISYNDNEIDNFYLIVHHLLANESESELYPLCFGGKYVFKINTVTNKIIEINYSQEYQVENTLYIKDWNFAKKVSDLSIIASSFDINRAYSSIMKTNDINKIASDLVKLFCLALDSNNIDFINQIVTDDVHLVRPKTMSYGQFEALNKSEIPQFINDTKEYYSMDQYSITINHIQNKENITLNLSHLIPHRTGTKKLNVNTKYHSSFDEDITITLINNNNKLLIKEFICNKITDIHYNGFNLLRI